MLGKFSIAAIRPTVLAAILLCVVSAQADSPVTISEFDFVELDGRIGHLGLVSRKGHPMPGPGFVRVVVSGEFHNPTFKFVDAENADISVVNLTEARQTTGPRSFMGSIVTPDVPFRLMVDAQTHGGELLSAASDQLFQPTTVLVRFDESASGGPPGPRSVKATVINTGPAADFELTAFDDEGTTIAVTPTSINLPQRSTAEVTVDFEVPRMPGRLAEYTLTLEAVEVGLEPLRRSNQSSLNVFSDLNPQIYGSGFEELIK